METFYSDSELIAKSFVDTELHPEQRPVSLVTEDYRMIVAFKDGNVDAALVEDGIKCDAAFEIDLIVNGMEPRMAAEVLLRMAMDFYKNALMAESPVADFIGKALDAGVPPEVLAEFMADMAEKAQAAA